MRLTDRQDARMRRLNLFIPESLFRYLEDSAIENESTMSFLVREAIRNHREEAKRRQAQKAQADA